MKVMERGFDECRNLSESVLLALCFVLFCFFPSVSFLVEK